MGLRQRLEPSEPFAWKLPKQSSSIAPPHVWTNAGKLTRKHVLSIKHSTQVVLILFVSADQDPVPEDRQTWTSWTFIGYWYSDLVTISTWTAASSIMTTGLSATDAILIVLVASICNAIPTVLNGAIGSELHIPFPIAIRASFGYWFSYFAVISRAILALFWFGVQSAQGGACVKTVSLVPAPGFSNMKIGANFLLLSLFSMRYALFHRVQYKQKTNEKIRGERKGETKKKKEIPRTEEQKNKKMSMKRNTGRLADVKFHR
jgi:NCS1 family nucleobase:cation symporter-1